MLAVTYNSGLVTRHEWQVTVNVWRSIWHLYIEGIWPHFTVAALYFTAFLTITIRLHCTVRHFNALYSCIMNWSHIAIHLVVLVLVAATSSKKPMAPSFEIRSGRDSAGMIFKQIRIDWRCRSFDLTSHFQDGGHNVISHRKVLPPGEYSRLSDFAINW